MRILPSVVFIFIHTITCSQPFNFTTYREANGLPSGYIQSAFEDSRGYLWLGTFGGLSRFDGKNFVNYGIKDGLPSNSIEFITEDDKGRLWLATRNGVSLFDGKSFHTYPFTESKESVTYYHYIKKQADNRIHCAVANRLFTIVNDRMQAEPSPPGFQDSMITNQQVLGNGMKVLTTRKNCYLLYPNGKQVRYEKLSSIHLATYFPPWDKNSFYILGSTGVYHWQNGKLTRKSNLAFEGQILTAFFVDNKHRIWVAAESHGVKIINDLTNTVDSIETLPILVPNIYQDRQNTIWICTFRGLVKASESYVTHYDLQSGLISEDIRSAGTLPDGKIFMGANLIEKGNITQYPPGVAEAMRSEISFSNITTVIPYRQTGLRMFSFKGKIFDYISGQLTEQTAKTGRIYTSGALCKSGTGQALLASNNLILVMQNDSITGTIDRCSDGTLFKDLNTLKEDAFGNTWIDDNGRPLLKTGNTIVDFFPRLGLPATVKAVMHYSDQQGCWFITKGYGIIHFKHTNKGFVKDLVIDKSHGLPNDNILNITIDKYNYLWAASFNGLCWVNLNQVKSNDLIVHPFSPDEGFDIPNWNQAFLEKDELGNVWLGVANGIYKLNAKMLETKPPAPSAQIENAIIINDEKDWKSAYTSGDNYFHLPENVSLNYDQNNIVFYFKGIHLKTGSVKCVYMLEGQEKAWRLSQLSNSVTYNNLAPGTYTFKAKALNDYGTESNQTAEFRFVIRPPFWQTWWFRLLVAALCISMIYLFVKQREKSTAQKNELRLQMSELRLQAVQSQMNPHFIFNSLNSIQNFIVQNNQIEAARYLSRFSKLIRRILDNSHHQFLKIEEIVETLKMYVELEAFRFNQEFTYAFDIDQSDVRMDELELPPMLLQPFVENAILHGLMPKEGEKHLQIRLFIKENCLNCIIEDNGIGRKEKVASDHISRGEKLTRGMLDSLKHLLNVEATVAFEDLKDESGSPSGTKVIIRIPVNHN